MRTLFQTIKQQFLEENDLVLVSVTASSGINDIAMKTISA